MYKFLSLVALLFLTGCYSITHYPEQQDTISKSTITHTEVRVIWHKSVDEINAACRFKTNRITYACASVFIQNQRSICLIHTIEPNDFTDQVRLMILGHEFWHCLGARHK